MSLNWDTSKVQYFKDNPDDLWVKTKSFGEEYDDVNAETKSLIFGSMSVGLPGITNANQAVWYARWKVLEKLHDYYLYSCYTEVDGEMEVVRTYLTKDVIQKHIGLSTNVGRLSDKDWAARIARSRDSKGLEIKDILNIAAYFKLEFEEKI